ncbi:hypothetical protein CC78DRAFT_534174 [Lojkania enalia]|uniref:Uncharacterized protein n=1 Tax=Lojkania enalia TaxID=147567 RepID=A0A9P4N5C8_9PLEO|nr:hypothetical protein CC78DRAFT_534174 [Didymosphaeria enalia]
MPQPCSGPAARSLQPTKWPCTPSSGTSNTPSAADRLPEVVLPCARQVSPATTPGDVTRVLPLRRLLGAVVPLSASRGTKDGRAANALDCVTAYR